IDTAHYRRGRYRPWSHGTPRVPARGGRSCPSLRDGENHRWHATRYPAAVSVKLVLVMRTDLDMGRGKIAAQAAHAAVAAALGALGSPDFRVWLREGQPKVVLKVSGEDALLAVCAE